MEVWFVIRELVYILYMGEIDRTDSVPEVSSEWMRVEESTPDSRSRSRSIDFDRQLHLSPFLALGQYINTEHRDTNQNS